jgi:hypothetical protein
MKWLGRPENSRWQVKFSQIWFKLVELIFFSVSSDWLTVIVMDESMDDDISQPKAMGLPPPQFWKKVSTGSASYCDEAYNVTTYGLPHLFGSLLLLLLALQGRKLSLQLFEIIFILIFGIKNCTFSNLHC